MFGPYKNYREALYSMMAGDSETSVIGTTILSSLEDATLPVVNISTYSYIRSHNDPERFSTMIPTTLR